MATRPPPTPRARSTWLLPLLVSWCIACHGGAEPAQPPAAPTPATSAPKAEPAPAPEPSAAEANEPTPQQDTPSAEQMQSHFVQGTQAQDALIRGDLGAAKAAAATLARETSAADLPPTWARFRAPVTQAAQNLANAPSLAEAGQALARLGVVCGDCHAALGTQLELGEDTAPPGEDLEKHMRRHEWATDRMWEGLVAPAPDRFSGGAQALVEAPLHRHALSPDKRVPRDIAGLAKSVHSLAATATQAATPGDRAHVYGQLIVMCTDCHRRLEVKPKSP